MAWATRSGWWCGGVTPAALRERTCGHAPRSRSPVGRGVGDDGVPPASVSIRVIVLLAHGRHAYPAAGIYMP